MIYQYIKGRKKKIWFQVTKCQSTVVYAFTIRSHKANKGCSHWNLPRLTEISALQLYYYCFQKKTVVENIACRKPIFFFIPGVRPHLALKTSWPYGQILVSARMKYVVLFPHPFTLWKRREFSMKPHVSDEVLVISFNRVRALASIPILCQCFLIRDDIIRKVSMTWWDLVNIYLN